MLSAPGFGKGQKSRFSSKGSEAEGTTKRRGVQQQGLQVFLANDGSWNEALLKMVVRHPVAVPGLDRGLES